MLKLFAVKSSNQQGKNKCSERWQENKLCGLHCNSMLLRGRNDNIITLINETANSWSESRHNKREMIKKEVILYLTLKHSMLRSVK